MSHYDESVKAAACRVTDAAHRLRDAVLEDAPPETVQAEAADLRAFLVDVEAAATAPRFVCAWCAPEPERTAPGLSHGICSGCVEKMRGEG